MSNMFLFLISIFAVAAAKILPPPEDQQITFSCIRNMDGGKVFINGMMFFKDGKFVIEPEKLIPPAKQSSDVELKIELTTANNQHGGKETCGEQCVASDNNLGRVRLLINFKTGSTVESMIFEVGIVNGQKKVDLGGADCVGSRDGGYCYCKYLPSQAVYQAKCVESNAIAQDCMAIEATNYPLRGFRYPTPTIHLTKGDFRLCVDGWWAFHAKSAGNGLVFTISFKCDQSEKVTEMFLGSAREGATNVEIDVNFGTHADTYMWWRHARCYTVGMEPAASEMVCECDPLRKINVQYLQPFPGRGFIESYYTVASSMKNQLTFQTHHYNQLFSSEFEFVLPRCDAIPGTAVSIQAKIKNSQPDENPQVIGQITIPRNGDPDTECKNVGTETNPICQCPYPQTYSADKCGKRGTLVDCHLVEKRTPPPGFPQMQLPGLKISLNQPMGRSTDDNYLYLTETNTDVLYSVRYRLVQAVPSSETKVPFDILIGQMAEKQARHTVTPTGTFDRNYDNPDNYVLHFRGICESNAANGHICYCCSGTDQKDPICSEMDKYPDNTPEEPGKKWEPELPGKKPDDPETGGEEPGGGEQPGGGDKKPDGEDGGEKDPGGEGGGGDGSKEKPPKEPTSPKEESPEKKEPDSPTEEKPKKKECEEMEAEKERELCRLEKETPKVTEKNLDAVLEKTTFDPKNLSADGLNVVSSLITNMAAVANMSPKQQTKVFGLIDSALSVDQSKFADKSAQGAAAQQLIKAVESIAEKSEKLTYLGGSELAVHKEPVDCSEEGWLGLTDDGEEFKVNSDEKGVAAIRLEAKGLCEEDGNPSAYFVIYRNSKLFEPKKKKPKRRSKRSINGDNFATENKETEEEEEKDENKVRRCGMEFEHTNGMVLTSVVQGQDDPKINAKLRFAKEKAPTALHSALVATWWTGDDWATDRQCRLVEENGEMVAHCDHLTNFALLIQKNGADPLLCDPTLDKLGFWLTIASAIALLLLCLIYATRGIPRLRDNTYVQFINNSRSRRSDFVSVCSAVVMFVFYLAFALLSDQTFLGLKRAGCSIASGLLYSAFMGSIVLNIFQAWNLMLFMTSSSQTELILSKITKWYVVAVAAFVVPLLSVLIIGLLYEDFFYRGDQFCWIQPDAVIYAVIVPVSLMLINSTVAFILFALRLVPDFSLLNRRPAFVKLSAGSAKKRSEAIQKFVALFLLQFSLGIPWVLQYPAAFSPDPTGWHYAFAILNGLGGVVMLLVYVYGRAVTAFKAYRNGNSANTSRSEDDDD